MRLLLPLLLAGGCAAEVDIQTDPDGDGLSDAEEVAIGSDRVNPDSDEDGFWDGDEVAQNTDPADYWSRPYDACRDSVVSTGAAEGEVSADFSLTNQHGTTTRLYDYCEHVVLLVNAGYT